MHALVEVLRRRNDRHAFIASDAVDDSVARDIPRHQKCASDVRLVETRRHIDDNFAFEQELRRLVAAPTTAFALRNNIDESFDAEIFVVVHPREAYVGRCATRRRLVVQFRDGLGGLGRNPLCVPVVDVVDGVILVEFVGLFVGFDLQNERTLAIM